MRQLPLKLQLCYHATFDNFCPKGNEQLVRALKAIASGSGEQFVYFWGKSGVGKSHLLQACCHLAHQWQYNCWYLSLIGIKNFQPQLLDNLDQFVLVCIDDLQQIAGNKNWEQALFHCYNRLRQTKTKLIIAADKPAKSLAITTKDLTSRLTWGLAFKLLSLDDKDKLGALLCGAKARGMMMPTCVGEFLISHYQRDMKSLMMALDKLDHASLTAKRKLTIPFIKSVLTI